MAKRSGFDKSIEQRYDINKVAYLFYGLCYFEQCPPKNVEAEMLLRSHVKLVDKQLALIFKDYLSLIVGGEVRHATEDMGTPVTFKNDVISNVTPRLVAYECITKCRLRSVINVCKKLFSKRSWYEGFGGKNWKIINSTLEAYVDGRLTPKQFIDKCFFIVHNGDHLFTKNIIFDGDECRLRNWLDGKNNGWVDEEFKSIKFFGFLQKIKEYHILTAIKDYKPIKWGKGTLDYTEF